MTGSIVLRPGIPDDDNRDYLPEYLKDSEIVVNENGNNSQPYPHRLTEHRGIISDGVEDIWYTYVPESYDPDTPTPLVISMHGGLMTGWGQAIYTSWVNVADREGFIVLFPSAGTRKIWVIDVAPEDLEWATTPNPQGVFLNRPPAVVDHNHDIRFVLGLIEKLAADYSIDRQRIFMQGMSMGNAMTSQFARYYGHVLAGAAGSGGPTNPRLLFDDDGEVINRAGPLAVWQSRLDLDDVPPHYPIDVAQVVVRNRDYWLSVNGVTSDPAIAIRGDDNLAFYRGAGADLVFRDVFNRDHGQTFDDAELVWDYLFSGTRRCDDGTIETTETLLARTGDTFAVAVADGCRRAWVSGRKVDLSQPAFTWNKYKYHGLEGATKTRGSYQYVTVSFIASTFGGQFAASADGTSATLTLADGRTLQFARGQIGCVLDGRITCMLAEAVHREGELCISLEWFAAHVLDLHVSTHSGALYVTDHHARLAANMARLISDLLV